MVPLANKKGSADGLHTSLRRFYQSAQNGTHRLLHTPLVGKLSDTSRGAALFTLLVFLEEKQSVHTADTAQWCAF